MKLTRSLLTALLPVLISCATAVEPTESEIEPVTNPAKPLVNPAVFPLIPPDIEKHMIYPSESATFLSDFGAPVDAQIEAIFANGVHHWSDGLFEESAILHSYALQKAADQGAVLSRVQLFVILKQRAYAVIDAGRKEEAEEIWTYQTGIWSEGAHWRDFLPEGLQIVADEDDTTAAYYLAESYGQRSVCRTVLGKYDVALEDVIFASDIYAKNGFVDEPAWYFLTFISNCYNLGEFEYGLKANSPAADLFAAFPNRARIEDMLMLGRLTALCSANLGDFRAAFKAVQGTVQMADSVGFVGQYTQFDKDLLGQIKGSLASIADTPQGTLMDAIIGNNEAALKRILTDGADPNRRFENETPMMILARNGGSVAMADMLLEAGADPSATGYANITALAIAAAYTDNLPLVVWLLDAGADVNIVSPVGYSPLMMATRRGTSPEIVRTLLDYGADPSLTTNDGASAMILANNSGNEAIINMLETALSK